MRRAEPSEKPSGRMSVLCCSLATVWLVPRAEKSVPLREYKDPFLCQINEVKSSCFLMESQC